jgi:hypothetical protein
MLIVMCRQFHHGPTKMCYPLAIPCRLAYVCFSARDQTVTDSGLAKRPQSAISRAARTARRVYGWFGLQSLSVPTIEDEVRRPPRVSHKYCFMQAVQGSGGLQLSTRALVDPTNNGRPRLRLAIAGWCYGASGLHSSAGVGFNAKGAVG